MKILLCGHRSFASQGLLSVLQSAGHEVTCFSRGPQAQETLPEGVVVTGPVASIDQNPYLQVPFDVVINYILAKDDGVQSNLDYVHALLALCQQQQVKQLIHIASVSSFRATSGTITETSTVETDFSKKGSYGALKAATDYEIEQKRPQNLKLSLVRPGFIVGQGLVHPFVGMGVRLPWNRLLSLGSGRCQFPLISREILNQAILKTVEAPPQENVESLLLVDKQSPSRRLYLQACCTRLGAGLGADNYPEFFWWIIAVGAEGVARAIGKGAMKPYLAITSKLTRQQFDSSWTETRLGLSLSCDWRAELQKAMDGQTINFEIPVAEPHFHAFPGHRVNFIGYGRIVKTRHRPALEKSGFQGEIRAYDVRAGEDESGQKIEALEGAQLETADLTIVATPGPVHTSAIPILEKVASTVLIEKPLCYSKAEFGQWQEFAAGHAEPVVVCHNYRFKKNLSEMMQVLLTYNSGRLRHVKVHFDSPPVSQETAVWARNERRARTLLMDYGLHFLDMACMFNTRSWQLDQARYSLNTQGQTDLIEGHFTSDEYTVAFLLRQGFGPRRADIEYTFQNYSIKIGFFPDMFFLKMADETHWLRQQEAKSLRQGFYRKIADIFTGKDSDNSHALVQNALLRGDNSVVSGLTVGRLSAFYNVLFDLAEQVYGNDN